MRSTEANARLRLPWYPRDLAGKKRKPEKIDATQENTDHPADSTYDKKENNRTMTHSPLDAIVSAMDGMTLTDAHKNLHIANTKLTEAHQNVSDLLIRKYTTYDAIPDHYKHLYIPPRSGTKRSLLD